MLLTRLELFVVVISIIIAWGQVNFFRLASSKTHFHFNLLFLRYFGYVFASSKRIFLIVLMRSVENLLSIFKFLVICGVCFLPLVILFFFTVGVDFLVGYLANSITFLILFLFRKK